MVEKACAEKPFIKLDMSQLYLCFSLSKQTIIDEIADKS